MNDVKFELYKRDGNGNIMVVKYRGVDMSLLTMDSYDGQSLSRLSKLPTKRQRSDGPSGLSPCGKTWSVLLVF